MTLKAVSVGAFYEHLLHIIQVNTHFFSPFCFKTDVAHNEIIQ